ncbi:MAG: secondary thiamine-phosphate synthase enzyme YjbQ [Bradymonadaceae bacterium]
MIERITVQTSDQGLVEITDRIQRVVRDFDLDEGMCTIFIQHTSASLVIQENAAAAARRDLENWFNRLVEEDDPLYTHTAEGPDDMPAHIKSALTHTSLDVPILDEELALGTWQGIFLWEHRYGGRRRNLVVHAD